jgi:hypothetical protein
MCFNFVFWGIFYNYFPKAFRFFSTWVKFYPFNPYLGLKLPIQGSICKTLKQYNLFEIFA